MKIMHNELTGWTLDELVTADAWIREELENRDSTRRSLSPKPLACQILETMGESSENFVAATNNAVDNAVRAGYSVRGVRVLSFSMLFLDNDGRAVSVPYLASPSVG